MFGGTHKAVRLRWSLGSPMAFRTRRIILTAASKGRRALSRPRLEHDNHRIVTIKCSQQMAAQDANAHRPRLLSSGVRQGRSITVTRPMQPRPRPKGLRERRDEDSSAATSSAGAETRRGVHSMLPEHDFKIISISCVAAIETWLSVWSDSTYRSTRPEPPHP